MSKSMMLVILSLISFVACEGTTRPWKHYYLDYPNNRQVQLEDPSIQVPLPETDGYICQPRSDFKAKEAYLIEIEEALRGCQESKKE